MTKKANKSDVEKTKDSIESAIQVAKKNRLLTGLKTLLKES